MESIVTDGEDRTAELSVSIPFKREGAWKDAPFEEKVRELLVSIPFKREGAWKECGVRAGRIPNFPVSIPFKREGAWKVGMDVDRITQVYRVSIPFKREGAWKVGMDVDRITQVYRVSIPFKREGAWKETLFSTQTGRGSVTPKTKHELRRDLFARKITPKIPQTLVAIEPNAIFQQKRLETQARSMFVGNLKLSHTRSQNRVCFYKYTQNSHISQTFFIVFSQNRTYGKKLTELLKIIKMDYQEADKNDNNPPWANYSKIYLAAEMEGQFRVLCHLLRYSRQPATRSTR